MELRAETAFWGQRHEFLEVSQALGIGSVTNDPLEFAHTPVVALLDLGCA